METKTCPLCGGCQTHFVEYYGSSEDGIERPFAEQECFKCRLLCKHWQRIAELYAALQASTELLRCMFESYITQPRVADQLAANTAALRKAVGDG